MNTRSFSADDFTFRVPITFRGDPVDLSEAVAEVAAQLEGGGPVVTGVASMNSGTEVRGRFDDGALAAGVYKVQVRCTLSGETQTVAEWTHVVTASIKAA